MKLEDYLKENELNQIQFAEMSEISASTICRILKKQGYTPGIETIHKIVKHTGGKVDYRDFAA